MCPPLQTLSDRRCSIECLQPPIQTLDGPVPDSLRAPELSTFNAGRHSFRLVVQPINMCAHPQTRCRRCCTYSGQHWSRVPSFQEQCESCGLHPSICRRQSDIVHGAHSFPLPWTRVDQWLGVGGVPPLPRGKAPILVPNPPNYPSLGRGVSPPYRGGSPPIGGGWRVSKQYILSDCREMTPVQPVGGGAIFKNSDRVNF